MVDVRQMKSLALAYIGDAIYEIYVREYLIRNKQVQPQKLHEQAIHFVSAKAQAKALHYLIEAELLTEEEAGVVRRGRNAKSGAAPKNTSVVTYRHSTAFEALLGYLYLDGRKDRLDELVFLSIKFIVSEKEKVE